MLWIDGLLVKHEIKNTYRLKKTNEFDVFNFIFSTLITIFVATVFFFILYKLTDTYVHVKVNGEYNIALRSMEVLTIYYAFILVIGVFFTMLRLDKVLFKKNDILLSLPIRPESIFVSKIVALFITQVLSIALLIVPVNLILFMIIKAKITFIFLTILISILMAGVIFLFASILIFPFRFLINALKHRYLLTGIIFTALISGAFYVYSMFLNIFRRLLETGNIRYIVNSETLKTMGLLYRIFYPANLFARIMMQKDFILNLIMVVVLCVISVAVSVLIMKKAFFKLMYSSKQNKIVKINSKIRERKPFTAMIEREFIQIYRTPNYTFQFFSLSLALPLVIYCCVTMFDKVVRSTVGMDLGFEISLFAILVFVVLLNTTSTTNSSREGKGFLNIKSLPCNIHQFVASKIVICFMINFISICLSLVIIKSFLGLRFIKILLLFTYSVFFMLASILFSTKLDLMRPNLTQSEDVSSRATVRFIVIGLIISIGISLLSIYLNILFRKGDISRLLRYSLPFGLICLYMVFSILFYFRKVNYYYNKI